MMSMLQDGITLVDKVVGSPTTTPGIGVAWDRTAVNAAWRGRQGTTNASSRAGEAVGECPFKYSGSIQQPEALDTAPEAVRAMPAG